MVSVIIPYRVPSRVIVLENPMLPPMRINAEVLGTRISPEVIRILLKSILRMTKSHQPGAKICSRSSNLKKSTNHPVPFLNSELDLQPAS